ncbi:PREDICTED: RING finger protein vilya isoform X2 [Rhagoletis zephyria]|uniref:RING finger protein vilya isoform X2 n=1 Tax=Rhagoletis zephyria TaxID=28612 RepID=UPI0008119E3A|nr:PREDICTED: RING finger protein vilya isoform X2 [Rhagoletis zephyria]
MENESLHSDFNPNGGLKLPNDVGLYWIHCNRCYEIYVHKRRRIFLLACYHTICEVCVGVPSANTVTVPNEVNCPLCKKVQRFRVLCNMMPSHFKELFTPEPWREPTERVLTFQSNQRQSFLKAMSRKSTELEEIKRKRKLLEIKSKTKYEKYEQLQYERKRLEREVRKLKEQELQQKRFKNLL